MSGYPENVKTGKTKLPEGSRFIQKPFDYSVLPEVLHSVKPKGVGSMAKENSHQIGGNDG